ncbi:hypothetical protein DRH14_00915 [Candidatus Shapirobacteria bacterium]|nr:MAG: hypothetical protein DRH14_00915 [Candidatus Shapirobacteria bacterium]
MSVSDSKTTTTSSSFIVGLVLGLILSAILAIVLYKKDKNKTLAQLKKELEKYFNFVSASPKKTIPKIRQSKPKKFKGIKK